MTFEQLELAFPDNGNGSSSFNDPAFAGNKAQPIHRWVPWIAGFAADFVKDVLARYVDNGAHVLDPFAGVGTTLVEAMLHGCHTTGFEINPYAALASRVKTSAHTASSGELENEIARFLVFFQEQMAAGASPKSAPPLGFRTRGTFYSPKVLHKVLLAQDFIAAIRSEALRDLFRVAFAATMVSYSNYSYEPSLGRRSSAGKPDIDDYPVEQALGGKLHQMAQDIAWFKAAIPPDTAPIAHVVHGSFFGYENHLRPASVDLVITSPPYLNNYHYNRNTRPQMYWLNLVDAPGDLKPLEENNFGKFWQTVRGGEPINLTFTLEGSDINERLALIRSLHPEKGVYGGSGWANYAASYFNDCHRFVHAIKTVLKPGGTALIVIGNSILQGVAIPTDEYLGQIAVAAGLELAGIDIPRKTRVGNSIIQSDVRVGKAQRKQRLYEAVVEIRQPR